MINIVSEHVHTCALLRYVCAAASVKAILSSFEQLILPAIPAQPSWNDTGRNSLIRECVCVCVMSCDVSLCQ